MTRKHYKQLAEALGWYQQRMMLCRDDDTRISVSVQHAESLFEQVVMEIAKVLKQDNSAFDYTKFIDAVQHRTVAS